MANYFAAIKREATQLKPFEIEQVNKELHAQFAQFLSVASDMETRAVVDYMNSVVNGEAVLPSIKKINHSTTLYISE